MDLRVIAEKRAFQYRSKLDFIDRAMKAEINKFYDQRRNDLLTFLHLEKAAHSLALVELEALLQGATSHGNNRIPLLKRDQFIDSDIPATNGEGNAEMARFTYRMITCGGIGDILLITPVIRKLKQLYPHCKIHVYCVRASHKEVLMNNKNIDRLVIIGRLTNFIINLMAELRFVKIQHLDYGRLAPSMYYRRKATEIIGEMLGIEIDDPRPECSLTEEEEEEAARIVAEYSNPVVIHPTAACTPNKNWPTENWENLVLNNPQYTFLQLGSADDKAVKGVVNMCGNTSIRQAISVVKMARAFVGVDSVLAHAAAAFRKPAVILFGASTPAIWGHAENINLYNPPRCSPCIDILGRDPCPYGRTCMTNIAVSDVERALSSLLAQPSDQV